MKKKAFSLILASLLLFGALSGCGSTEPKTTTGSVVTEAKTETTDFEAYAVDNGEKGDGVGLYVAYSNLENEAEDAPYTMTVNDAGQTVLTLTADDGTISWIRQ